MATKNKTAAPSGDEATPERNTLPEPEMGWPADAYTGLPGSFARDPSTGVRTPADDVARAAVAALEAHVL